MCLPLGIVCMKLISSLDSVFLFEEVLEEILPVNKVTSSSFSILWLWTFVAWIWNKSLNAVNFWRCERVFWDTLGINQCIIISTLRGVIYCGRDLTRTTYVSAIFHVNYARTLCTFRTDAGCTPHRRWPFYNKPTVNIRSGQLDIFIFSLFALPNVSVWSMPVACVELTNLHFTHLLCYTEDLLLMYLTSCCHEFQVLS